MSAIGRVRRFAHHILREEPATDNSREFSDYGLLGKNAKPLAFVESKKSSKDAELGREQCKQYCYNSQKKDGGELPFCFYTNGHDIFFWNLGVAPPQKVHSFPTRQDLERLLHLRKHKVALTGTIDDDRLAHASIMRVWNRLQAWVLEEQQASKVYLRLAESADCHVRGEQSLSRNPELAVGLQWLAANAPNSAWAARYRPGFEQATFFLNKKPARGQEAAAAAMDLSLPLWSWSPWQAKLATYGLLKQKESTQLRAANQQLIQSNDRLREEVTMLRSRAPHEEAAPPKPSAAPSPAPPESKPAAKVMPKANPAATPEITNPEITNPIEMSEFAAEMLRAHNAARQVPGVPPLLWSAQLAAKAQQWADRLAATGESRMEGIPGQNIAYAGPPGTAKPGFIVSSWAAEVKNFDYEKNACANPSLKCYHYTQVVWRESKYVGCATAHDAQRDIWVCDYDPPGNLVGARPY